MKSCITELYYETLIRFSVLSFLPVKPRGISASLAQNKQLHRFSDGGAVLLFFIHFSVMIMLYR